MSDKKKVTLAVIASLLVHLIFFTGFAAWLSVRPQASANVPAPDQPPELTLVPAEHTPAPPPREQIAAAPTPTPTPEWIPSDAMTEAEKPPENSNFQSDKDTLAASEKSGTGPKDLPTIEGKNQDQMSLSDQQLSLGNAGAGVSQSKPSQSQPEPQQQTEPKKESGKPSIQLAKIDNPLLNPSNALPTPAPTPEKLPDDALSIERATPTPTPTATPSPTASPSPPGGSEPPKPKQPAAGGTFRAQTQASAMQGGISNRGRPSIAARGTPLGRYMSQVYKAVGSRWYFYVSRDADLIAPGKVTVTFLITPDGKIEGLRLLSNTGNYGLQSVCTQAIGDAELPPIPEEVVKTLPNGRLEFPFSFTFGAP